MTKHTPGPWYLISDDGSDFTVIATKKTIVRELDMDSEVLGTSEWIRAKPEDLKLMATAPILLEAVKRLIPLAKVAAEDNSVRWNKDEDIVFALAAIAEATGIDPEKLD